MLNHEYPPIGGGSGVAMQYLAHALVEMGHDVMVLTAGEHASEEVERGVCVKRFSLGKKNTALAGMRWWLLFVGKARRELKRAVKQFRPDVINSHFVFPAGFIVAQSKLSLPHVTSVVGADIHDPTRRLAADGNRLVRWLSRMTLRNAQVVTTPSSDLTRRTQALFPQQDVRTVPWGVPLLTNGNSARPQLGLREDDFVIAAVCRLVRRKRLDVLLDALAMLRRPNLHLVIIGEGPEEDRLRKQAALLGLAESVHFLGRLSDDMKAASLNACDIFCLPSEHEGFGLVYLEAMGLGKPVVTTNVGGQTDIIREGVDGFLVPVGCARTLAERIARLCDHRDLLSKLAASARQRAREFTPDLTATAFARIFDEVSGKV